MFSYLIHPAVWPKVLSMLLMLLSAWFLDEGNTISPDSQFYMLAMFTENLVFVGSVSPFALYSISAATELLEAHNYRTLAIGYFLAVLANLASFAAGSLLRQTGSKNSVQFKKIILTFWHPQLAALTAYEAGGALGLIRLGNYLLQAIPVSAIYYTVVCVVLSVFPIKFSITLSFLIPCALVGVWLLLDVLKLSNQN